MHLGLLAVLPWITTAALADGLSCPPEIRYGDGRVLKAADQYYYPNGQVALRDAATLFYPSGRALAAGDAVYYPDGALVQAGGGALQYPSGSVLRQWRDGAYDYLYGGGQPFKRGADFYYANGQVAALGAAFFQSDGSAAQPPLALTSPVADYGAIEADLALGTAEVGVLLNRLSGQAPDHLPLALGIVAHWPDHEARPDLVLVLPGARGGEAIYVMASHGAVFCTKMPALPLTRETWPYLAGLMTQSAWDEATLPR